MLIADTYHHPPPFFMFSTHTSTHKSIQKTNQCCYTDNFDENIQLAKIRGYFAKIFNSTLRI